MTIRVYLSPTGERIRGTLETLTGTALICGINSQTGEPDYTGKTDVEWDNQSSVYRGEPADDKNHDDHWKRIVYLDEAGGEWTFDQLVQEAT